MSAIETIHARQILDSRGNPTVEVEVLLESGARGRAAVPSGASTGVHEAVELRDGEAAFGGKGVTRAVRNVIDEIGPRLEGELAEEQRRIDEILCELDGTDNKGRIGANAILGTSLAVAKAASDELGLGLYRYVGGTNGHLLPVPLMNVINGGAHADNTIDMQEFMVVPYGATTLRRGAAGRLRGVPRAEEAPARPGPRDGRGRRGRLRPEPEAERGCHQGHPRGRRAGRPRARQDGRHRARPRRLGAVPRRALPPRRRGARAGLPGARGVLGGAVRPLPDRVDRGRHGRGRLGRLAAPHRAARRARPARRGRPLRDQRRPAAAGHRAAGGQLDPDQAQPDRDAVRDARRDRPGGELRLHVGDLAPLGRDRGRDDRGHRGGHERRARSRPARRAARTAWPSTTSSSGSRRSSAARRPTPAGARSPPSAGPRSSRRRG